MRLKRNLRDFGIAATFLASATLSGCSICSSPHDLDYSAYGTATPRSDMRCGRVGSIFSDPAIVGPANGPSAGTASHSKRYGMHGHTMDEIIVEEFPEGETTHLGPHSGDFYSEESVILDGVEIDGIDG
jgi:hypothetical protein